ncbi:MAG TPA: VOC family protein [Terriglobales bacterium]|jgi:methylmalonyl-CoA/ethylmalonyl-CoA epimerase
MSAAPISENWAPQGSFHHVGFVVASIEKSAASFAQSLGAEWDGHIIHDPNQGVRVTFFRSRHAADPLFELVEPAGENAPVQAFVNRGGGLHHVCYEVENLEEALARIRAVGGLITRPPLPAVAFAGRRIAWVYTKNKLLIEYLERSGDGRRA